MPRADTAHQSVGARDRTLMRPRPSSHGLPRSSRQALSRVRNDHAPASRWVCGAGASSVGGGLSRGQTGGRPEGALTRDDGRDAPAHDVVEPHGPGVDVARLGEHAVQVQALHEGPGEGAHADVVQDDGDHRAQELRGQGPSAPRGLRARARRRPRALGRVCGSEQGHRGVHGLLCLVRRNVAEPVAASRPPRGEQGPLGSPTGDGREAGPP